MSSSNGRRKPWRAGAGRFAVVALLAILGSVAGLRPASAWDFRVCADADRLPFSREDGGGFENRIATLLAGALHADLSYVWFPQTQQMFDEHLRTGDCDIVVGVEDGQATLTSSLAYYRSPVVFIQRANGAPIVNMFDDPALAKLWIGVQPSGGVAHDALESRGLGDRIKQFYDYQLTPIIEDVAKGEIDIGIVWGPPAGYFAALADVPIVVTPVTPEFEPPFTPMFVNIVVGVRRGDESLRDLINTGIAQRWDEIDAVLKEFHVPTMPLPRPQLTLGAQ